MGQFAVPLMIAATIGSTAISVKSQRDAGAAAQKEAELAARKEGDAARGREIDRRRKLLQALADQAARAGAMGVAPGADVAFTDIGYYQNDMLTDTANTGTMQNMLRARGANAKRAGNWGAAGSILDAAAKTSSIFVKP